MLLLVDAANVVGSRPDGWWRDRAGAARRLVERLAALPEGARPADGPAAGQRVGDVVVVLEGAARAGTAEGRAGRVCVRHADGPGDDLLAELAGPGTLLVTADRELRRRAQARGAEVVGPGWLLRQLEEAGQEQT